MLARLAQRCNSRLSCLAAALALAVPIASPAEDLITLYQRALENNPTLKIQEHAVAQVEAQREQLKSQLLPQLSATGNYAWNAYEDDQAGRQHYTGTRGTFQARQSLVDFSTRRRLQGANEATLQARQLRESARMELAGELVDRYLSLLQATDDHQQLQAEMEATESQLKRLRFMQQRELAKITDLYEVEAYYSGLQTQEIEVRNARSIALEQLKETTGADVKEVPALARAQLPPLQRPLQSWKDDAIQHNASLAALSHATEAASKLVDSVRAQHLPRADLVASATYSDQGYDNRSVTAYTVGTVGAQISIPIYEGGRVLEAEREAIARREIARQQYEQSRREVERKITTAYLAAEARHSRIASKDQEVGSIKALLTAQHQSYRRGAATIVDVLNAQQRLFKARSEQAKARYDYIRDLVGLHILGGSVTDDLVKEVSSWMSAENMQQLVFVQPGSEGRGGLVLRQSQSLMQTP